ncbi:MAG: zinc ribbon domain-containing protein, partial [Synergistaceae bacterium]|nr:zinc ribbon domain-containing protein [Synergistaceae bacterium]
TVISGVILAVLMLIAWLFGTDGVTGILLLVWVSATGFVRFALMHYVGYLVKAGHIAVIAEAAATGRIPDDQVAYGKMMVTGRFATSNIYFAVDKLVGGAVKQLQGYLQKVGNALDFVPGMDTVVKVGKLFIDISLGYVDECCLGYTFQKRDQGAFRSAADGVVIYAQNWKKLLRGAAKTTLIVVILLVVITLVVFILLGLLCKLLGLPGYIAFLIACLIALTIKYAFIDSYILVNMMVEYMEAVPSTVLAFDLYGKLSAVSSKFKELYEKGRGEVVATAASAAETGGEAHGDYIFCGECGERNERAAKFCGKCGKTMQA